MWTTSNPELVEKLLEMFLWICVTLVTISMGSMAAPSNSPAKSRRDYLNEIGMVCSFDKSYNGSVYMNIGEKHKIGEQLKAFGKNRKVIFYINGYGEDMNPNDEGTSLDYFYRFTKDLITDDQMIVCAFDFLHKEEIGELYAFADYRTVVVTRVPFVAKLIKNIAVEMFEKKVFTSFDNFQFIGFSLGAHIAGVTARLIRTELGHDVPRIFALDPARTFVIQNENQLEKSDAKYVQAIFSSILSQHSIDVQCKIFINDAAVQPGCEKMNAISQIFCSHNYLPGLYMKIVREGAKLIAYKDPDDNNYYENVPSMMSIGHISQKNAQGVFYYNTDGSQIKKPRTWNFMGNFPISFDKLASTTKYVNQYLNQYRQTHEAKN